MVQEDSHSESEDEQQNEQVNEPHVVLDIIQEKEEISENDWKNV